MLDQGFFKVF